MAKQENQEGEAKRQVHGQSRTQCLFRGSQKKIEAVAGIVLTEAVRSETKRG